MGTKRNPGEFDHHAAAAIDEPIFTLRASDKAAPATIRHLTYLWRKQIEAGQRPPEDEDQVRDANSTADAMDAWRRQHKGRG